MFGPSCAPAGGSTIPASSFVIVDGMLTIVQCRIGMSERMASASCMMTA
jgi:hypothetical protein